MVINFFALIFQNIFHQHYVSLYRPVEKYFRYVIYSPSVFFLLFFFIIFISFYLPFFKYIRQVGTFAMRESMYSRIKKPKHFGNAKEGFTCVSRCPALLTRLLRSRGTRRMRVGTHLKSRCSVVFLHAGGTRARTRGYALVEG